MAISEVTMVEMTESLSYLKGSPGGMRDFSLKKSTRFPSGTKVPVTRSFSEVWTDPNDVLWGDSSR